MMRNFMTGDWGGSFQNCGTLWLGAGFLGFILMLAFWILIIVGIVISIRWLIYQLKSGVSGKMPLEILKERYAKGEISREEFEKMKKDLA